MFNRKEIDVKELLINGKREIIELNVGPWDILVLPKNRVLCSNYDNRCLTLYDENLNLIRTIDKINEESIQSLGIAIDDYDENHLYIAEPVRNQILKTDLEFNKINSVGHTGTGDNEFHYPCGICYKNKNLFICDNRNKRLKVYSKDLEFIKLLKVDYIPWVIKASNSLVLVQSGNSLDLYIYELNNLNLQQKIDDENIYCRISIIDSCFYRFNSQTKTILCYDQNANKNYELIFNNTDGDNFSSHHDGNLIDFNGSLLMTSNGSKKLIKFKIS